MFEYATRHKFRFATDRGALSTEDLWDLSLPALNKLAIKLNREIKESKEEDFLQAADVEDALTARKFEVVIYILNMKKAEKVARTAAAEKRAMKDKLLAALARKQDESIDNLSEEEIRKALAEL